MTSYIPIWPITRHRYLGWAQQMRKKKEYGNGSLVRLGVILIGTLASQTTGAKRTIFILQMVTICGPQLLRVIDGMTCKHVIMEVVCAVVV